MPIMLLAVVLGVLGLLLYQWGRITGDRLLGAFYAVAGAALGVLAATRMAGGLGPAGAVVAAVVGAVVVLALARVSGRRDSER